jgi:outer membrane protein OmpA-like peptidoglycan-associated protein
MLSLLGAASANALGSSGHGNDGLGREGVRAFSAGNFVQAEKRFDADHMNNPGNPITQFNLADSYRQRGQNEQANVLYRQAAAGGKTYRPDHFLEAHDSSTTIRDVACRHLGEDHQTDVNCPDLRAELIVVVPVPRVVEEAPQPAFRAAETLPLPPPSAPLRQPEYVKTFVLFFDFDKSNLTSDANSIVAEAVRIAKLTGPVRIVVTGHTDTVGTNRYNQALSERRAASVKAEMTRLGLDGVSIVTSGKSFSEPLIATGPGVREPQNRRAVIDLRNPAMAENF